MTAKEIEKLKKKRSELLEAISCYPYWISGSVVESTRKQSGKDKPFRYLSRSIKGKNTITYIAEKDLDTFKQAAENGESVRDLLAEICEVTIKLLKAGEHHVD
jgi:hypothetical protein